MSDKQYEPTYEGQLDKCQDERHALQMQLEEYIEAFKFAHKEFHEALDDLAKMKAERDEARRLLKAVVDMMRDNMAHDATHPHHLCDFIHRPDIGMCKVCEDWTDAMVMCYPDDFQDEEETK